MASDTTVTVVQGEHKLELNESEVTKYPKSFVALNLGFASTSGKATKTITVHERNPEYFQFVKQFYSRGKVKLLNSSVDLRSVQKELSFWFPGDEIAITYKDPVAQLAYNRIIGLEALARGKREHIVPLITSCAQEGYIYVKYQIFDSMLDGNPHAKEEYKSIYEKIVKEAFPNDEFRVVVETVGFDAKRHMLVISWKLGEGDLGIISEASTKAKSKQLLTLMLQKANSEWIKGYCDIHISKIFSRGLGTG